MKTKFKILFLMTILLSSCSDPIETQEPLTMLSTRSSYDSEYVEWDNVDHFKPSIEQRYFYSTDVFQ